MTDEAEARRRIDQARALVVSAFRLHPLDVDETMNGLAASIALGAEEMANDLSEAAFAWKKTR